MSEENKNQDELLQKREARRKRRQRNTILAYLVVIILIALVAFGILGLIQLISKQPKAPKPTPSQTEAPTSESESTEEEPSSETSEEVSSEPEETEPVVVELTEEEKRQQRLDQIVDDLIVEIPLEDKVAGLFIVTPEQLTGVSPVTKAGDSTKQALNQYAVGGILYSSKNVKNKDSFVTMVKNTVEYARRPLFLAVEEEGGTITQFAKQQNILVKTDSAKTIAGSGDPQKAYEAGAAIGTYLAELGINLNLAPVADLANVEKSIMEDRSFGTDAEKVAEYVLAMEKGLQEQGITPCAKHFVGMGSVTVDPAKARVESSRTDAELWADELVLFHKLADEKVPMIMISNVIVQSLSNESVPCCLSEKVVTDILRKELGYNGIVITDAMDEVAVTLYNTPEEAAVKALKAGCDMILCPENFEKAYNGVLTAVQEGVISEERIDDALRRIYRIKYADRADE